MINSSKKSLNEKLVHRIELIFDGKPWYGRSISSILSQSPELPDRALSILSHMIAWRTFVNATLSGNEIKIELNSEDDWPRPSQSSTNLIDNLRAIQRNLIEAVLSFDESKWMSRVPGHSYTYCELVEGIIDHDLYHLGQIALLRKM